MTSILINKPLGLIHQQCPLVVACIQKRPCLFVAWVQLSQICVALPGCLDICQTQLCPAVLKGGGNVAWFWKEFGCWRCTGRKCSIQHVNWYTIIPYLFLRLSRKRACHILFCANPGNWITKGWNAALLSVCFSHFILGNGRKVKTPEPLSCFLKIRL